jgi:hypothetical protein
LKSRWQVVNLIWTILDFAVQSAIGHQESGPSAVVQMDHGDQSNAVVHTITELDKLQHQITETQQQIAVLEDQSSRLSQIRTYLRGLSRTTGNKPDSKTFKDTVEKLWCRYM